MFSKVAALALAAPLVSALSVQTPTNWTNAGPAVVTWTASAGDPQSFDIELINPSFNSQFALANNVQTGDGSRSLNLPQVPVGDGYTLELTAVGNITNVLASTGDFAIGAQVSSSSTSSTSSSSGSSSSSTSASTTSSSSRSSSSSSSATSSSTSASSTSFNSGAADVTVSRSVLSAFAVMGAAALAGARLVGF